MKNLASDLILYNPLSQYYECTRCKQMFKEEPKALAHAEAHVRKASHSIFWNGHQSTWDCTCGKSYTSIGDAAYHQTLARIEDKHARRRKAKTEPPQAQG
jgi:hypothetical protein